MGVEVFYGSDPELYRRWIRENGAELDYVLLSRPTVAENFLKETRRHTDAKIIYYGHDLHFLRMQPAAGRRAAQSGAVARGGGNGAGSSV